MLMMAKLIKIIGKADLKSSDQPGRNVNVNDDRMTVICINNGCDVREMGGVTGH